MLLLSVLRFRAGLFAQQSAQWFLNLVRFVIGVPNKTAHLHWKACSMSDENYGEDVAKYTESVDEAAVAGIAKHLGIAFSLIF